MADFIIEYDHTGMGNLSKCISACEDEFLAVQKEMSSIVELVKIAIEGKAEDAYVAGHGKVSDKYTQIIQMLEALTSEMSGSSKKMIASDEQAANIIRSGFGKV